MTKLTVKKAYNIVKDYTDQMYGLPDTQRSIKVDDVKHLCRVLLEHTVILIQSISRSEDEAMKMLRQVLTDVNSSKLLDRTKSQKQALVDLIQCVIDQGGNAFYQIFDNVCDALMSNVSPSFNVGYAIQRSSVEMIISNIMRTVVILSSDFNPLLFLHDIYTNEFYSYKDRSSMMLGYERMIALCYMVHTSCNTLAQHLMEP
jgi:hypothetical protein